MKTLAIFLGCFLFSAQNFLFSADQKLIVIRHGEAENNIADVYNSNPDHPGYKPMNLTETGKKQIEKMAQELLAKGFNDRNIDVVFASPLPRTMQTAFILADTGLFSKNKIIVDNRLIETQAGDFEGKKVVLSLTPEAIKANHMETVGQIEDRVRNFLSSISNLYAQGNIVVVTHAGVAQVLIELVSHEKAVLGLGQAKIIDLH